MAHRRAGRNSACMYGPPKPLAILQQRADSLRRPMWYHASAAVISSVPFHNFCLDPMPTYSLSYEYMGELGSGMATAMHLSASRLARLRRRKDRDWRATHAKHPGGGDGAIDESHCLYCSYVAASVSLASTRAIVASSYKSSSLFPALNISFSCRVASSFVMQTKSPSRTVELIWTSLP